MPPTVTHSLPFAAVCIPTTTLTSNMNTTLNMTEDETPNPNPQGLLSSSTSIVSSNLSDPGYFFNEYFTNEHGQLGEIRSVSCPTSQSKTTFSLQKTSNVPTNLPDSTIDAVMESCQVDLKTQSRPSSHVSSASAAKVFGTSAVAPKSSFQVPAGDGDDAMVAVLVPPPVLEELTINEPKPCDQADSVSNTIILNPETVLAVEGSHNEVSEPRLNRKRTSFLHLGFRPKLRRILEEPDMTVEVAFKTPRTFDSDEKANARPHYESSSATIEIQVDNKATLTRRNNVASSKPFQKSAPIQKANPCSQIELGSSDATAAPELGNGGGEVIIKVDELERRADDKPANISKLNANAESHESTPRSKSNTVDPVAQLIKNIMSDKGFPGKRRTTRSKRNAKNKARKRENKARATREKHRDVGVAAECTTSPADVLEMQGTSKMSESINTHDNQDSASHLQGTFGDCEKDSVLVAINELSKRSGEPSESNERPPLPPRKTTEPSVDNVEFSGASIETGVHVPASTPRGIGLFAWIPKSVRQRCFGSRIKKLESLFKESSVIDDEDQPLGDVFMAQQPSSAKVQTADIFSLSEAHVNAHSCNSGNDSAFLPSATASGQRLSPFLDLAKTNSVGWTVRMARKRHSLSRVIKSCFSSKARARAEFSALQSSEVA